MWPRGAFLLKLKPYNGDLWAEPELFIRAAHPGIQHRHSTLKGSWPWGMAIIFLGIVFAYLGRVVIFLQPQGCYFFVCKSAGSFACCSLSTDINRGWLNCMQERTVSAISQGKKIADRVRSYWWRSGGCYW